MTEDFPGNKGKVVGEYQKLKKNYKEIEESLHIISDQNKRLVESNKDLVC